MFYLIGDRRVKDIYSPASLPLNLPSDEGEIGTSWGSGMAGLTHLTRYLGLPPLDDKVFWETVHAFPRTAWLGKTVIIPNEERCKNID